MSIQERERQFYNELWKKVQLLEITGKIRIPGVKSLKGKRILICSCGSGSEAVISAKQGADTYAFDISEVAVENTVKMAKYNNVIVKASVMDFHNLSYEDNFFDIVYGYAILHHVDCSIVGKEIYRVLKPDGIAFFHENSDNNPILRFLRRLLFGKPNGYQRQKFMFIKREGSTDEYPLTKEEVEIISKIFNGNVTAYNEQFIFFSLLNRLIFRNHILSKLLKSLDSLIGNASPFIKKYSFSQEILLSKQWNFIHHALRNPAVTASRHPAPIVQPLLESPPANMEIAMVTDGQSVPVSALPYGKVL